MNSTIKLQVSIFDWLWWFSKKMSFLIWLVKILILTAYISEVNMSFSNDMDDEYGKLFRRMNPPRYVNFLLFLYVTETRR